MSVELGSWIPIVSGIPESLSCIPHSTSKNFRILTEELREFSSVASRSWSPSRRSCNYTTHLSHFPKYLTTLSHIRQPYVRPSCFPMIPVLLMLKIQTRNYSYQERLIESAILSGAIIGRGSIPRLWLLGPVVRNVDNA